MGSRRAVCLALDPIPSTTARGVPVHRHCTLPAGHTGCHASFDGDRRLVHEWEWIGENDPAAPAQPWVQPGLFATVTTQGVD